MFLFTWRRIRTILVFSGAALSAAPAWPAERQVLQGHVPEAVARGLAPAGRLPAWQALHLAIGLPLRHREALTNLLRQLYDPASPLYHQYLNPEQFTASYGPEEKDYQALRQFAESHGLTVTGTHPNRMVLDVTGTVADVEKAFHVNLGLYPHPTEPRTFYAPDVEPALDLDVPVLAIAGLSDYARPHPASLHARPAAQQRNANPNAGSQNGDYVGLDFRAAYVPGVTLAGAGQSVALVEFDTYYAADISKYLALSAGGLANSSVTLTNVVIDGPLGSPGSGNTEVALDIDMAICMAPGLSSVMVYEAPNNTTSAPDDMFNRIATDNLARQVSSSWSGFTDATLHQVFQEFAAQGQSFFIAAGDEGACINPQNPPSPPADDTYVTSVGGTTLSTTGPRGGWASETTWNWFSDTPPGTNGTSGGTSPTFAIPSWQQGLSMSANHGSTTFRNFPDVAMVADQAYVIADNGTSYTVGGTSVATPLWAGLMALVNEQNAAVGQAPAGFFNPALYALCEGANYGACFHDITTGNNTNLYSPNLYFAVSGYDLCTGWGTPMGSNLITVLAAPPDVLQITPFNGFSASATVGGPVKPVSQNFLLTNAGTAALNWTLANPAAWLSNSASGGALPAGGFTNVTVSLNSAVAVALPVGVYTTNIWFTNLNDGAGQSRQFTLTVAALQLVQNGGFETGDFTSWTLTGSSSSLANFVGDATSLYVTTGYGRHQTTTYYGSYYIHSGSYAAFLGESGGLAYLSQTLTTVPGQAYLLSFWLVNPGKFVRPPTPNQFTAAWNGNTIFNQANMGVFSYTNMQYVVAATGASTALEFGAQNNPDYFGLDDVSVTPIPPPVFQSAASTNGTITLTWAAVAGVAYQLQYTTNLSLLNWSNLGAPITATSGAIATSDVQPADPQRFYRVLVAP
jgi:subtilase family serine protease